MSTPKKKIVYISLIENPINNGIINSQVINILKIASDNGYETSLYVSPSKKLYRKNNRKEMEEFQENLRNNNIKYYCKPIPLITNACIRTILLPFFILFEFIHLFAVIIKEKPDLLHCRSYPASLMGMIFKKLMGVKYIFDMRGIYPEEGNFLFSNWNEKSINYRTWKIVEKLLINSADTIVVVSEHFEQYIRENFQRSDSVVIYCSPENQVIAESHKKNNPVKLVYSGTLDGWTTPELLAQSFKKLLVVHGKINIFLNIYTGTNKEKIQRAFANLNIPDKLYSIEKLPASKVFDKLTENDIGLLVREYNIVNQVSFPVKFGEYISAGLPVIINDVLLGVKPFLENFSLGASIDENEKVGALLSNPSDFTRNNVNALEALKKSSEKYMQIYKKT